MKTINETYKAFCKLNNLDNTLRVGELSAPNLIMFLDYLDNVSDDELRAVYFWMLDEDMILSYDISTEQREIIIGQNTEDIFKYKPFVDLYDNK